VNNIVGASSNHFFFTYSISHIIAATIIFSSCFFIFFIKKTRTVNLIINSLIVCISILSHLIYYFWLIGNNLFSFKSSLPLSICGMVLILIPVSCFMNSKIINSLIYFLGFFSIYAIISPVLIYGFPHIRFIQFFMAHGIIIFTVFYYISIGKIAITGIILIKSIAVTYLYGIILYIINLLLKSNYGYIMRLSFIDKMNFINCYFIKYLFLSLVIITFIYTVLYIIARIMHDNRSEAK